LSPRALGERRAIWLITAMAAVARLAALSQPMRYDESVTWAYFVGRSWSTVVSAYQFPNNHVFFSLLAKATSALAPFHPWALRLPAFVAGVAIVPLTWAVGRRFASSAVGLLGAALAAGSTSLVLYSTNARGYSIVVALFLVLLLLADRLRVAARPIDWMSFATLGAVGLYTIPVMLYPLGVVAAWLLLSARRAPARRRRPLIAGTVLACAAAGAIALILYLPIIRSAGLGALAGNSFVQPSTWGEFATALPRHVFEVLLAWSSPVPPLLTLAVVTLALLGLHGPARGERASLSAATVLWCGALLLATHRVPFVRVWLFALPLYLLAVARGLLRVVRRAPVSVDVGAVALATLLVAVVLAAQPVQRSGDTGAFPAAREVAARLAGELRPGDRVLAPIPTNGPLLYYFSAAGLDTALLNTPPAQTRRAFLVLEPERGRTLDWAVSRGMIDPRLFTEPTLLLRHPDVELWRTERRQ
jgi:hypothetical protein